jgi:acyl-CoA dehydrogenase
MNDMPDEAAAALDPGLDRMLAESAERLFAAHSGRAALEEAERGVFAAPLWEALEEAGIARAAATEAAGGADLPLPGLLLLTRIAAAHAAPVPLAETLLAQHLLSVAGIEAPSGPLTVAPTIPGDAVQLSGGRMVGRLRRVPWARHAAGLVVLIGDRLVLAGKPEIAAQGANYAAEPRDDLRLDAMTVLAEVQGPDALTLRAYGALFRAAAMAGALARIAELTVRYAGERVQFGRPIAKFQAVQHQIAVLATQAASAQAAVERAGLATGVPGRPVFEAAAAKLRAGEAATQGAAIAHQVHGAIGFTYEHMLHFSTRRLWSWREEFGDEAEWAAWIGALVRRQGGAALWPMVTQRAVRA